MKFFVQRFKRWFPYDNEEDGLSRRSNESEADDEGEIDQKRAKKEEDGNGQNI